VCLIFPSCLCTLYCRVCVKRFFSPCARRAWWKQAAIYSWHFVTAAQFQVSCSTRCASTGSNQECGPNAEYCTCTRCECMVPPVFRICGPPFPLNIYSQACAPKNAAHTTFIRLQTTRQVLPLHHVEPTGRGGRRPTLSAAQSRAESHARIHMRISPPAAAAQNAAALGDNAALGQWRRLRNGNRIFIRWEGRSRSKRGKEN
jgi:hypothetical protein